MPHAAKETSNTASSHSSALPGRRRSGRCLHSEDSNQSVTEEVSDQPAASAERLVTPARVPGQDHANRGSRRTRRLGSEGDWNPRHGHEAHTGRRVPGYQVTGQLPAHTDRQVRKGMTASWRARRSRNCRLSTGVAHSPVGTRCPDRGAARDAAAAALWTPTSGNRYLPHSAPKNKNPLAYCSAGFRFFLEGLYSSRFTLYPGFRPRLPEDLERLSNTSRFQVLNFRGSGTPRALPSSRTISIQLRI